MWPKARYFATRSDGYVISYQCMGRAKIMIVEDERLVALELRLALEELGYVVTGIADTGEGAVLAAGASMPDLIIMDIKLKPGPMDGIEAAKRIRELYNIGYIYVTGNADESTYQRAMRSSPLGYFNKPLNEDTLDQAIQTAITKGKN